MTIAPELLRRIVEGALLASGQPLSEDRLLSLIDEGERPEKSILREVLQEIADSCGERGFELREVASGWRFQVPEDLAPWVNRLWEEKPQKYSRAVLETLAIIAYRQPITRGDIEEIRGVAVSSHIVKTLSERGWIKVVGQRDVPGRPSLYATTKEFLDYFNLRTLDDLPTLSEIRDIDSLNQALDLGQQTEGAGEASPEASEAATEAGGEDSSTRDGSVSEGEDLAGGESLSEIDGTAENVESESDLVESDLVESTEAELAEAEAEAEPVGESSADETAREDAVGEDEALPATDSAKAPAAEQSETVPTAGSLFAETSPLESPMVESAMVDSSMGESSMGESPMGESPIVGSPAEVFEEEQLSSPQGEESSRDGLAAVEEAIPEAEASDESVVDDLGETEAPAVTESAAEMTEQGQSAGEEDERRPRNELEPAT
ncbi:SMC-Scp complex subunit ScpB [Microbulbifer flavimaris]|uniref:SMC-Scp complex subunit ScpB n=1 Tax=Microbulbifer flavimaris TaxID=1781068 RepID=A0ABX4I397_9GAMM|nr:MULTISPECIES: SMC-Scp complex subunit ScpB [Microbulbifer]PCO06385.1 SMC-Scp complex subunit ScpB [Microbulbifer flavimaris]